MKCECNSEKCNRQVSNPGARSMRIFTSEFQKCAYAWNRTQEHQVKSALNMKINWKIKNNTRRESNQGQLGCKRSAWKSIEKKWKVQALESNQRAHGSRCAQLKLIKTIAMRRNEPRQGGFMARSWHDTLRFNKRRKQVEIPNARARDRTEVRMVQGAAKVKP